MSFTMHCALEDCDLKPIAGVKIGIAPASTNVIRSNGVLLVDTAEGLTDPTGQCDISMQFIAGSTWLAHSTGRFDLVFNDSGGGVVSNLADATPDIFVV